MRQRASSKARREAHGLIRLSRDAQATGKPLPENAAETAASDVGNALMAPLDAYQVNHTELLGWDLGLYATAVCQALAFLKQVGDGVA